MLGWNESVGFALFVGAALKGTVVLGAAWLLARTLRRQSAAARHLVWTAAAAALLALPVLSVALPALLARTHTFGNYVPTVTFHTTAVARPAAPATHRTLPAATAGSVQKAQWRPDVRYWMPRLWAAGTLIGLVQILFAWGAMRRLRRSARVVSDSPLFFELAHSLDIHDRVELIELPAGAMPMNFGVLRPAVFVPSDAQQWSEDRQRVVLLHELAHVKRGDVATNMLMRLALCLFWWNPLAWAAWRESVKERERAADDLVLAAGEAATMYASHLLEIARSMQTSTPVAWAALAMARPSELEGRLLAILDSRIRRKTVGTGSAIAAAAVAILLVAPFAAVRAQEQIDPVTAPIVDAAIKAATAQNNQDITDSTAAAFTESRKYEAAQKLLENSLTIRAQKSGESSSAYAIGLMKLGDLAVARGKSADAVDFYTRAVALGDTPETAPGLIYLATHALVNKDLITAQSLIERALTAAPKGPVAGRAQMVDADIAIANELPGVAEFHYQQALREVAPESAPAALVMEKYGKFLKDQNRRAEAEPLLASAKTIRNARVAAVSSHVTMADPVLRVGGGVSAPVLLKKSEPEYTEDARVAKYQGTSILYIMIGTDGMAHNLQVVKSLGYGLDEKAAEAVSQWKFTPGTKNGVPVTVEATVEVNFRLL